MAALMNTAAGGSRRPAECWADVPEGYVVVKRSDGVKASVTPASVTPLGKVERAECTAPPVLGVGTGERPPSMVVGFESSQPGQELKTSSETKEIKAQTMPTTSMRAVRARMRPAGTRGKQRGKGKRTDAMVTKVTWPGAVVSSAATVLNDVVVVSPSLSTEWASLKALYDECRVVATTIHFRVALSDVSGTVDGGCVYDPINASTLASVADCLQFKHHLIWTVPGGIKADATQAPLARTPSGFYTVHAVVPKATVLNVSTPAYLQGWASTADSADKWGAWKFYATAASASVTCGVQAYVESVVEFRNRD